VNLDHCEAQAATYTALADGICLNGNTYHLFTLWVKQPPNALKHYAFKTYNDATLFLAGLREGLAVAGEGGPLSRVELMDPFQFFFSGGTLSEGYHP